MNKCEKKNVSGSRARKNWTDLEREMKGEINEMGEEEEKRDNIKALKSAPIISAKFAQVKFT